MAVFRTAEVASSLMAKGMTQDQNHHHMFRLHVDGVATLVTRLSHGSAEIDDHLCGLMARQCGLKLAEFKLLIQCPLSHAEWLALIAERFTGGKNPLLPG